MRILGYNSITLVDQAAAAGIELAKAEMDKLDRHVDPHTAGQLRDKVFVDDGVVATKIIPKRSWTMLNYNPCGFLPPLWLRANASIRQLQDKGRHAPWDHNMEPDKQSRWAELFAKILDSDMSCLPKVAAPPEGEEVHVVFFVDSILSAVCAVAYAIWPLPEGSSEAFDSSSRLSAGYLRRLAHPSSGQNCPPCG